MAEWRLGRVMKCIPFGTGVQELDIIFHDASVGRAIHYTDIIGPVLEGDEVLLNTTAVSLKLGTGGYHFVLSILQRQGKSFAEIFDDTEASSNRKNGHMMKLRYTPLQRQVLAAEEENSPFHALFKEKQDLDGMPVLIGELHSMLPVAVCWICARNRNPNRISANRLKIVYIMSDGGALPIQFSRHVRTLSELGWLQGTITYGHAYGGDLETINKFTALIAAKHILKADLAIVAMGPGIAGTGTRLGYSGVETGEIANAVSKLGGRPVMIPRISFAETRSRHNGLSHHTLTTLTQVTAARTYVPLPAGLPQDQIATLCAQLIEFGLEQEHDIRWMNEAELSEVVVSQQDYPWPITTMGRGTREDAAFFQGVCAAAEWAVQLVSNIAP